MIDPLAEIVLLLRPGTPFSKVVSGSGEWSIRRSEYGQPFYCAVLEGCINLAVDGHKPIDLRAGDFVLIPSASAFTVSGFERAGSGKPDISTATLSPGEIRHGVQSGPPDVRLLVGYCVFGSPDAALLVSLLPQLVHIQGEARLATLVQLVAEESRAQRPARDLILTRLLEVLLIEAFRSTADTAAPPGLLRGLADERLAIAIRRMHENPSQPWSIAQLAKEATLSRSAFFARFSRAVGIAPMQYLLGWRMALAKNLLQREDGRIADVARNVGYSSASTFSIAFTRYVGLPPTRYAQAMDVTIS